MSPADPLCILVTGSGAPGIRGTIHALRHNPDGRPVRLVVVDINGASVGRYFADAFHTVPPPEAESYMPELLKICSAEHVRVIVPQTTREIMVLSREKDYLRNHGIEVMVSGADAITVANDKWRLMSLFRRQGMPCPEFYLARNEAELLSAAAALGYPQHPIVVKPPISNGMRGVRVLRTNAWDVARFLAEKPSGLEIPLEDLTAILRRGSSWPSLLVMEYLPGQEFTVDAFSGKGLKIVIPRERVAIRSGITFHSRSVLRSDLIDQTLAASTAIGLEYAFGFQFKLDSAGTPKILECNPRVQGTMVASVFSGANVIWLGVRELLGDPVDPSTIHLRESEFVRFWGGVGESELGHSEI